MARERAAGAVGAGEKSSMRASRLQLTLLALLVLLMPVTSIYEMSGTEINFSLADPVLLIAGVYLVVRFLHGKIRAPMLALFLLNIAVILVSDLVNIGEPLGNRGPISMLVVSAKAVCLWLNVFVLVNCVENRRDFLVCLKLWITAGVVVALLGAGGSLAYQMAGIQTPYSLMFRAQGTLGDANLFATHLSLCLFLTLFCWKLAGTFRLWMLGAMVVLLAGIGLSASRGPVVALVVSLSFLWLISSSLRVKIWSTAAFVVIGLVLLAAPNRDDLLASNPVTQRLSTATTDISSPEASSRKVLWLQAAELFSSSPLIGVGRGNFVGARGTLQEGQNYAHNSYLQLLAEVGLIGCLLYALVALRTVWIVIRAKWMSRCAELAGASGFLLAALATVALNAMTINLENYRGAWLLVGLVECYRRLYVDREAREIREGAPERGSAAVFEPAAPAA